MKKILVISWAMPPLIFPRSLQVSRLLSHLARLGFIPTVITVRPSCIRRGVLHDKQLEEFYQGRYGVHPVDSNEQSFLSRLKFKFNPHLAQQPDEKIDWAQKATKEAIELCRTTDFSAVISFAQPWSSHTVGFNIHQATGLPWIAHFSDPWVDSPYFHFTGDSLDFAKEMEERIVQNATRLIFVNRETAETVMKKYHSDFSSKARVVGHGYEKELVQQLKQPEVRSKELTLVHSGHFYGHRSPEAYFKALSLLKTKGNLEKSVRTIFLGPIGENILRLIKRFKLEERIELLGAKPYMESLIQMKRADVLLLIEAAGEKGNLFLPSKLIDYLPFEKPIFGLTPPNGPSSKLLSELGCPMAQPDDSEKIFKTLLSLIDLKKSNQLNVSGQYTSAYKKYDIRNKAKQMEEIVNEVGI